MYTTKHRSVQKKVHMSAESLKNKCNHPKALVNNTDAIRGAGAILQRAAGHLGLENIKTAIYQGDDKAQHIAKDIYDVNATGHDGDFTKNTVEKIKKSAEQLGYKEEYARRLAEKDPFKKIDITGNTRGSGFGGGQVTSFEESGKLNRNKMLPHQLSFTNEYGENGRIDFLYNARNPALANFYATDVVSAQREFLELGNIPITMIVRENIISQSGLEWRRKYPENGQMSAEALKSFIKDVENGRSSQRIANIQGALISHGKVSQKPDGFSVRLYLTTSATDEEHSGCCVIS